jgi:hypothetical protein
LTVEPVRELRNLTVSELGAVRVLNGGWTESVRVSKLNVSEWSVLYPGCD